MTTQQLIAAGFKPYQDNNAHRWLRDIYELRDHDRDGVRYVIHVRHCVWPDGGETFEMRLQYLNGIVGWASNLDVATTVNDKTPEQVIELAAALWERLRPRYYRRDQ